MTKEKLKMDEKALSKISLNLRKFLEKKKLKFKPTILMGRKRIRAMIFRSNDLVELFKEEENFKELEKLFQDYKLPEKVTENLTSYLDFLLATKAMIKLDRFHDVTDPKKYKWPKKMNMHSVK